MTGGDRRRWTAKARTATRGEIEHAIEITDSWGARRRVRQRGTLGVIISMRSCRSSRRRRPRKHHGSSLPCHSGREALRPSIDPDRFLHSDRTRLDRAVKFFAYERDRVQCRSVRSNWRKAQSCETDWLRRDAPRGQITAM